MVELDDQGRTPAQVRRLEQWSAGCAGLIVFGVPLICMACGGVALLLPGNVSEGWADAERAVGEGLGQAAQIVAYGIAGFLLLVGLAACLYAAGVAGARLLAAGWRAGRGALPGWSRRDLPEAPLRGEIVYRVPAERRVQ